MVALLGFNDAAKHTFFYLGLKDTIKNALAIIGEEKKLDLFIKQIIAVDQRQHQC